MIFNPSSPLLRVVNSMSGLVKDAVERILNVRLVIN